MIVVPQLDAFASGDGLQFQALKTICRLAIPAITVTNANGGVALQGSTPGTQQTGNLNISGTGIFGTAVSTPSITISGLTQGSVLFAGVGGIVSQDNAGLYYSGVGGLLAVGTGKTIGTDASISTIAIIGRSQAGESNVLTIANTNAAATGDTAAISFIHGGYSVAIASVRSVVEQVSPALAGIGFSTYSAGGFAERHRMRNDGRMGFGIHSPFATGHFCSQPTWQLGETIVEQATADTVGPVRWFRKERGTIDTPAQPTTGDTLGSINWTGYGSGGGTAATLDNRAYITSAQIRVDSAGTIAATRVAGIMRFFTGTNVAPTVLTEAMRIDEQQRVGVNMTPARVLDVTGTFGATGAATLGSTLATGATTITPATTGTIPLVIAGLTGQTVDLIDHNINAVIQSKIDKKGSLQTLHASRVAPWIESQFYGSGDTTINSSTYADVGVSVTFTPPSDVRALVVANCDVGYGDSDFVEIRLNVNGSIPAQIVFASGTTRNHISPSWTVDLSGGTSYTIKLQVARFSAGTTGVFHGANSSMSIVAIGKF